VVKSEHPSREQLLAFAWGHLSGADLRLLERHINACDACCQVLRDVPDDALLSRLRDAITPMPGGVVERSEPSPPRELAQHPRYQLGRFLGAGGMGSVFQAEHRLMGRTVALKIIHGELTRNPRVLERFRQEVKAAARLGHPNIVAAYDAEQAGDIHFLVMEFVDGMSLAQIVATKGPLEIASACNFARQAAKGLQHAHEAGMVHRDIKPHNLMLTRKGQVKILDFGLARMVSESSDEIKLRARVGSPGLTKVGDIMGTPDFMAPEQIADPRHTDIRADIYSLGCTLYHLLTGQSPFNGESGVGLLLAQQSRSPRPITQVRAEVPAELVAIIGKALAKLPGERYQTPDELVKDLTPFTRPRPFSAGARAINSCVATAESHQVNVEPRDFEARCPFCVASTRIPARALGASIRCPHCSSFFTAVRAG
jgi:serine/threonine protein kinase